MSKKKTPPTKDSQLTPAVSVAPTPSPTSVEQFVQSYGDLLFDLIEFMLQDTDAAQILVQSVLKSLDHTPRKARFHTYERAWVLNQACGAILDWMRRHPRPAPTSEPAGLEANAPLTARLQHFAHYYKRLSAEDQILLLLRDKYGIPYAEIAAALEIPEGSLKVRRQQSLRSMEEWLWGTS